MNSSKLREGIQLQSGPAAESARGIAHPMKARQNDEAPLNALIDQSPRMQLQRKEIDVCFGSAQVAGIPAGGGPIQLVRVQRASRLPFAETMFRRAHAKAGLVQPIRITRPDHAGSVKAVVNGSQAGVDLFIRYWNILKEGGELSDDESSQSSEESSSD